MTDTKLIDAVADLWQEGGGDAEGMEYCWHDIVEELKRREPLPEAEGKEV